MSEGKTLTSEFELFDSIAAVDKAMCFWFDAKKLYLVATDGVRVLAIERGYSEGIAPKIEDFAPPDSSLVRLLKTALNYEGELKRTNLGSVLGEFGALTRYGKILDAPFDLYNLDVSLEWLPHEDEIGIAVLAPSGEGKGAALLVVGDDWRYLQAAVIEMTDDELEDDKRERLERLRAAA